MSPITKLAAKVMANEQNRHKKPINPSARKLTAIETRQISESNLSAEELAAAFGLTVTQITIIRDQRKNDV